MSENPIVGFISRYEAINLLINNDLSSIVIDNDKYEYNSSYWRMGHTEKILYTKDMKNCIEKMNSFLYNREEKCLHCC